MSKPPKNETAETKRVSLTGSLTPSPMCIGAPDDYALALGKLNFAFGALEYAIRLAAKRLAGVSLQNEDGKKITKIPSHNKAMKSLKKEAENKNGDWWDTKIKPIYKKIGLKSKDGLYGQRNQAIHLAWISGKSDIGEVILFKLNLHEQNEMNGPLYKEITIDEIDKLTKEIETTTIELLDVTKPLIDH